MIYSQEIIDMLKKEGITLDNKIENTIDMLVYKVCEKAKDEGVQEGIQWGINNACKAMEEKIKEMKKI
ncbi:MAG: hypothetical protein ACOCUI_00905 [bacterium]